MNCFTYISLTSFLLIYTIDTILCSFERDYPRFVVQDSTELLSPYDDINEDAKPKHNVEYLPFWKQLPPKKGKLHVDMLTTDIL